MKMSNKVYDVLKWIAMVCLPAVTTLWLTLASIWQFPYAEPIGATLGAVTVFLGALLGISSIQYAKVNANCEDKENG
jgi:hypothetical protein